MHVHNVQHIPEYSLPSTGIDESFSEQHNTEGTQAGQPGQWLCIGVMTVPVLLHIGYAKFNSIK